MKNIKFGDILSVEEGIIVHGCNSLGIMGSGIALQIKQKYPLCFLAYQRHIQDSLKSNTDVMGTVVPYKVPEKNLIIMNAITQKNFGKDGKKYVSYESVFEAFKIIVALADGPWERRHVHYPLIGAGLGGGDWSLISELIDNAFGEYQIPRTLWIYE
jgi:O-acetyl-ADP-ribose deacetylase (regulator of RNase III)